MLPNECLDEATLSRSLTLATLLLDLDLGLTLLRPGLPRLAPSSSPPSAVSSSRGSVDPFPALLLAFDDFGFGDGDGDALEPSRTLAFSTGMEPKGGGQNGSLDVAARNSSETVAAREIIGVVRARGGMVVSGLSENGVVFLVLRAGPEVEVETAGAVLSVGMRLGEVTTMCRERERG